MKKRSIVIAIVLLGCFTAVNAQKKKVASKKSSNVVSIKVTERNFGSPASISDITDLTEADVAYTSVKNLIEKYGVTTTYADNTFRGKEPLKRGDFIVTFNSALINIRKSMESAGIASDTTLINTYDRNRNGSYLTEITQVKDVSEKSIYYEAAKSLIERFGIAAPFALNKTLSANSTVTEKEVYDILRTTLSYNSAGSNPYASAITRNKFAIVLNNAIGQKMTEIYSIQSVKIAAQNAERQRQLDSLQVVEKARKDSVSKEIELRKQEAAKKEEEARKALQGKKNK